MCNCVQYNQLLVKLAGKIASDNVLAFNQFFSLFPFTFSIIPKKVETLLETFQTHFSKTSDNHVQISSLCWSVQFVWCFDVYIQKIHTDEGTWYLTVC